MKNKILFFIPIFFLLNNSCDKNESDEPEEKGTIVIDFTTFELTKDNPAYTLDNITVEVTETTSEDGVVGKYSFGHGENSELWLYPARLEIDLHNISGISEITVTGNDNCGFCTKFFFYDGDRNVIQSTYFEEFMREYSISFDSELENIKSMAISSGEASVGTITIK